MAIRRACAGLLLAGYFTAAASAQAPACPGEPLREGASTWYLDYDSPPDPEGSWPAQGLLITVPPQSSFTLMLWPVSLPGTGDYFFVNVKGPIQIAQNCSGPNQASIWNYYVPQAYSNPTNDVQTYLASLYADPGCYVCVWSGTAGLELIGSYACTPDVLEPNSISAPRRLAPVQLQDLRPEFTGLLFEVPDAYRVRVPPGTTIDARISFNASASNLDLRLYSESLLLAQSTTTSSPETAVWTNTGTAFRDVDVRVGTAASLPFGVCVPYQLDLDVNDPALGNSFCISAPNSTQVGASLRGFGSNSLAANNLSFAVEGLPPSVPCLLYYGTGTTQVPFGDGFRCVAGATFREATVFSNAIGEAIVPFDPASSQPAGVVTPGSTWNFQAYYRNLNGPMGSGFNLSDGYTITFLP